MRAKDMACLSAVREFVIELFNMIFGLTLEDSALVKISYNIKVYK